MKIIKGDTVTVISGKDKGRQGQVIRSLPKTKAVVVQGLNLYRKHLKPQSGQKGGIVQKERPLNVSKVALLCPQCKKPTKVGYQVEKSGDKYRICRRCRSKL